MDIYIYLRSVSYSAIAHMILRVKYRWHIITSGKFLVFTKVSWSRSCVIRKRLSWITSNSFSCCFNCKYGCISVHYVLSVLVYCIDMLYVEYLYYIILFWCCLFNMNFLWFFRYHLRVVSFLHWLHVIFVRFTCGT